MAHCMAFNISPPAKKGTSSSSDEDGIPVLVLKEFEVPPTVCFGKVPLGSSKESILTVHNPNKVHLEVALNKLPECFHLKRSWSIGSQEQLEIRIEYTPTKLGASRKSIKVETDFGQFFQFFVLGECVMESRHLKPKKSHFAKKAFLNSTRIIAATNKPHLSDQQNPNLANVEGNIDDRENVFREIETLPLTPIRRETYMVVDESARRRALLDIPPLNADFNIQNEIFLKPHRESTHERKNWSPVRPVLTENLLGLPQAMKESLSSNETLSSLTGVVFPPQPKSFDVMKSFEDSLALDDSLNRPNDDSLSDQNDLPESHRGYEVTENNSMVIINEKRKPRRSYSDSQVQRFRDMPNDSLYYEVEPTAENVFNNRVSTAKKEMKNIRNLCSISKVSFNLPDFSDSVIENKSSLESPNRGSQTFNQPHGFKELHDRFKKPAGFHSTVSASVGKASIVKKNKSFVSPNKSIGRVQRAKSFSHSIKPVAQAKLSLFASSTKTTIPQHPNMFASKNIFYDERWQQKEETAFTRWINYLFTPPEEFLFQDYKVDVKVTKLWTESLKMGEKSAEIQLAPDKEALSLKLYTSEQNKNKLRRSACFLFQSEEFLEVLRRIEEQISLKRIAIREDRKLHADFGLKQIFLTLLLCYNPLWLHLGLETVFGECIYLPKSNEVVTLSKFIVNRLLFCREIAMEFQHKIVPNSFREGYEVELSKFILRKFLFLIFFLDKAKNHHLIEHDPCLFNKTAQFKASKDILICFSREFLKGEGDITRHLLQYGYIVSWQQKPIEEFDFAVTNISQDLRCGTRLGRICELLFHSWIIADNLRVPAPSRTLKMRNVDHVLNVLRNCSVKLPRNLKSTDIVDGHREQTLALLWAIIFKTQVEPLISGESLRRDILYLIKSCHLKKKELALKQCVIEPFKSSVAEASELYKSELSLRCLLRWCQVIGECYGIEVNNFTVSFSDGRAFCYIIHHYHPNILPKELINEDTMSSFKNTSDSVTVMTVEQNKMFLRNEKQNLLTAFEKMRELGGIPIVANVEDICNTIPDEKVVITLLSYLNMRLSNLGSEIRAARTIQLAWKNYCLKKRIKLRMEKAEYAVIKIQNKWRATLLMRQERNLFIKVCQGIIKAQATYRMHLARKSYLVKYSSAIVIQRFFRTYLQVKNADQRLKATLVIQRYWKRYYLMKATRLKFLNITKQVIKLQSFARMVIVKKQFQRSVAAVVKIQAFFKMIKIRKMFKRLKHAVHLVENKRKLQLVVRAQQGNFLLMKNSAIKIQAWFRGVKERKVLNQQRKSAIMIQKHFRMFRARLTLKKQIQAAILLQQFWKNCQMLKKAQTEFVHIKRQIIICQSSVRMFLVRKKYKTVLSSAIKIQSTVKMFLARNKYKKLKKSVKLIGSIRKAQILGRKQRHEYLQMKCSTIKIQAIFRGWRERKVHLMKVSAAVKIQKHFQMHKARALYKKTVHATIIIQRFWRRCYSRNVAQAELAGIRIQIVKCQSYARMFLARRQYMKVVSATLKIQANFKMIVARNKYRNLKKNVKFIETRRKSVIISRNQRSLFVKMKYSAVKIQAIFRGWRQRKAYLLKVSAAIKIQKQFQMYKARAQYRKTAHATIVIQRFWRRCYSRKIAQAEFNLIRSQIIKCQAIVRMIIARRWYEKVVSSAVKIQSYVKMILARNKFQRVKKLVKLIETKRKAQLIGRTEKKNFQAMKQSAIKIQSHFRAWRERKLFQQKVFSAIIIQKQFRMYKEQSRFSNLIHSAIQIQKFWRKQCLRRKAQEEFKLLKSQTIKVQSYFRMFLARRHYREIVESVIKLQAAVRMFLARNKFRKLKRAVCLLEQVRADQLLTRSQATKFLSIRKSVIRIQAMFRGHVVRKALAEKSRAATRIQSVWRGCICRAELLNVKKATVVIQRRWRCYLVRKNFIIMKLAVLKIEQYFNHLIIARKCRQQFLRKKNATVVLQAYIRGFLCRREIHRRKNAAIKVQSFWRRYKINKSSTIEKKRTSAAISIQKLWRGYTQRKKEEDKAFSNMRRRIQNASEHASAEKKYSYLTRDAVRVILTGRLNNLIQHLMHLEKATRLSERCRQNMLTDGLIPALINLMRSCNRSLPHVEVLTWCCNVLLNFSVYEEGSAAIWSNEKFIEFAVDMMKRFPERDTIILQKMASLIIVLCQDSAERLNELKNDEMAMKGIASLFNIAKRKFEHRQHMLKIKQATGGCFTKKEKEERRSIMIKHHNLTFLNALDALSALKALLNFV